MTGIDQHSPAETRHSGGGAHWTTRRVVVAGAIALLLLSLGYVIGLRSPWSAHHPQMVIGMAERTTADEPYAYFDPENGDRVAFRLTDVVWRSAGRSDNGTIPPCLRTVGERVRVQVGLIEVSRPFGSGSYRQVLSVRCPE